VPLTLSVISSQLNCFAVSIPASDVLHAMSGCSTILLTFKIVAHRGSTLVPFLLWAPAFLLGDSLLWLRLVTALVTLATAVVLYLAGSRMFSPRAGFSAAMLFLFSFHVLRFGIRAVPDPFGSFFAMLSLWLLVKRKAGSSGAGLSSRFFRSFRCSGSRLGMLRTAKGGSCGS